MSEPSPTKPPLPLVISIQSQVVHGHVGNSAAAYPMRAAGVEVVEVPTTLLSNHPYYPSMRGRVLEPELVADLLTGVEERGLHRRASVIVSGFLGRAATGQAVAKFVAQARAVNPAVIYVCDPVMGDADLGFFAAEDLRRVFAEDLVPAADIIFPNAFELGALAGFPVETAADVARAQAVLKVPTVVATSVPVPGAPDRLATVTASAAGLFVVEKPRLPARPAGTGDLLAALSVARIAQGVAIPQAVARAVEGVQVALERTSEERWSEMPIASEIDAILGHA